MLMNVYCKVTNIRPKYNNLKDWTEDKNNVYISHSRVVFIDKKVSISFI